MSESPTTVDAGEECTTTGSFDDHGIGDGADLIARTYYRLQGGDGAEFEPTETFFDRLESAFLWAYLGSVEGSAVPAHVEMAVEDARAHAADEFENRPDADLRTAVVPAFYRRVADFHCVYRD